MENFSSTSPLRLNFLAEPGSPFPVPHPGLLCTKPRKDTPEGCQIGHISLFGVLTPCFHTGPTAIGVAAGQG